jgi:RNA polymerase sigma-70 factor, ECF subfamily
MSSKEKEKVAPQLLLELARQAVLKHLLLNYRTLTPTAIKVLIACLDHTTLVEGLEIFSLSDRPSIRNLAKECQLSKATVQSALQILNGAGLIQNGQLVLLLDKASVFFQYNLQANQVSLSAVLPTNLPANVTVNANTNANAPSLPAATMALPLLPTMAEPLTAEPLMAAPLATATPSATPGNEQSPRCRDLDLIALYQTGDQDAFAELYQRHFESVRTQVSRHLPGNDSYDVVQQVFLGLMEKLKDFKLDGSAKFSTWLYKFTEFSIANARRKHNREMQFTSLPDNFDVQMRMRLTGPRQQIMPYMLKMNKEQQECVYLHYYEGLSYQDISRQLDIDEKIVRNNLQTARRQLRDLVKAPTESKNPAHTISNKFFLAALEKEQQSAERENREFTLCLFSLKPAFTSLLAEVLGQLSANSQNSSTTAAFALGPEQFALILPATTAAEAQKLLTELRLALNTSAGQPVPLVTAISQYAFHIAIDNFLAEALLNLQAAEMLAFTPLA